MNELNEVKSLALAVDQYLKNNGKSPKFHDSLVIALRYLQSESRLFTDPIVNYWINEINHESDLNKRLFSGQVFKVLDGQYPVQNIKEDVTEWSAQVSVRSSYGDDLSVVNVVLELDHDSADAVARAAEQAITAFSTDFEIGCLTGDHTRSNTRHVSLGLRIPVNQQQYQQLLQWAQSKGTIHGQTRGVLKIVTPPDIRTATSVISEIGTCHVAIYQLANELNSLFVHGNYLPSPHITQANIPIKPAPITDSLRKFCDATFSS